MPRSNGRIRRSKRKGGGTERLKGVQREFGVF